MKRDRMERERDEEWRNERKREGYSPGRRKGVVRVVEERRGGEERRRGEQQASRLMCFCAEGHSFCMSTSAAQLRPCRGTEQHHSLLLVKAAAAAVCVCVCVCVRERMCGCVHVC